MSNKKNKNSNKRDFSAFDSIQHLELEDKAAEKLRRKQSVKDVARAKAARSQTKIYGHLMESRILLQRTLHQVSSSENNNENDAASSPTASTTELKSCDKLLNQLLLARRQLMGWNENNDQSDDTLLQSEYDICRDNWKEVLNRRHQDLRLHAGLASTSKTQFRVMDSSFWQQVESTVAHEEMRQRSNANNNNTTDSSASASEWFDDSKVYQQMLKDFLVTASNNDTANNPSAASLQRMKHSKKKQVDRKASKGRKIRYVEMPKLVSFTFPISRESKTSLNEDEWFQSLFGGAGAVQKQLSQQSKATTDEDDSDNA